MQKLLCAVEFKCQFASVSSSAGSKQDLGGKKTIHTTTVCATVFVVLNADDRSSCCNTSLSSVRARLVFRSVQVLRTNKVM